MKFTLACFVACLALMGGSARAESIGLRVVPERDLVLNSGNSEVVFDINLHGASVVSTKREPVNLALVVDRSGSMEGAKIEKARQAACTAIDQLQPTDTFSLVQFDNQVDVLVPAQPVEDKERLKDIVSRIKARGSTALYAGVKEGEHQLRKYFDEKNVNRIILVSDGIANVGPSSPDELADMARGIRDRGGSVTTVGLGDDYNEDVMASIAEASGANYYYVRDAEKLPGVFEKELGEVTSIVAQNLRIIIELPEGVEPVEIVGMPDVHFQGQKATVRLGSFYASQRRDLLVRCRIKAPRGDSAEVGRVQIAYAAPGDAKERQGSAIAVVKFTDQQAVADRSVNNDVAVQVALAENAAARRRALALQDSGQLKEAAVILRSQARTNEQKARLLKSAALAGQADAVASIASQFDQAQPLSNRQRKSFQYDNYNQANQKGQQ